MHVIRALFDPRLFTANYRSRTLADAAIATVRVYSAE